MNQDETKPPIPPTFAPPAFPEPPPPPPPFPPPPPAPLAQHDEVMAELHKLQTKRTNWWSGLLILVVSLALFIGAASVRRWEALWLLIPLLFFHELGHYLAMRIFGYRNLQMFFIPFLGAAVSGTNYTAPGWKKVIVALAGPLPGIVLGGVLGVLGIVYERPMLLNAAVLALILNGFNLLPVLPLDGGRVMHTLLFARHHLLDVTFRVLAAGALAGIGALTGDRILLYLGIFMLIGVPAGYRLAKIATDLRRAGVRPGDLPADHAIPPEVAAPIIERVQAAFPRVGTPKIVARHTLHVYETLATRPPGWLASVGLGAVHAGSFLVAALLTVVMVVAQHGNLGRFARAAAAVPTNRLDAASITAWDNPSPIVAPTTAPTTSRTSAAEQTIIATFDEPGDAVQAFVETTTRVPSTSARRAVLFGQSVLVSLPAGDDEHRRAHLALFEPRTKQVFVKSKRLGGTLFLTCIARNAAEAEAIVAEVNRAVRVGGSLFLIPPWDPDDRRPPAERTRHDRARQTYEKIVNAANDLYDDPELKSLVDKLDDATRRGDAAESEKLQSDHEKLYEVKLRAAQRRVAETADGSIDAELAERFLALQDPTARTVGFKRYVTELGPLMGQVPMDGDAPAAGAERYIASFGSASREGLLVTIRGLTFADDAQGAPALVAWLGGRGCVDFRYRFSAAGLPQDFDLTLEP